VPEYSDEFQPYCANCGEPKEETRLRSYFCKRCDQLHESERPRCPHCGNKITNSQAEALGVELPVYSTVRPPWTRKKRSTS
jgi:uncharacterized paraquat-inducible protein A